MHWHGESMVHERVADLRRMGRADLLSERLLNQKQMQDEIGADRDVDASLYTGGFFYRRSRDDGASKANHCVG